MTIHGHCTPVRAMHLKGFSLKDSLVVGIIFNYFAVT